MRLSLIALSVLVSGLVQAESNKVNLNSEVAKPNINVQSNVRTAAVEAPKMEAPSQAKVAATVAKDVMQDMVPANRRPLIYTIIAIVAVLILMLLFRSCGW